MRVSAASMRCLFQCAPASVGLRGWEVRDAARWSVGAGMFVEVRLRAAPQAHAARAVRHTVAFARPLVPAGVLARPASIFSPRPVVSAQACGEPAMLLLLRPCQPRASCRPAIASAF